MEGDGTIQAGGQTGGEQGGQQSGAGSQTVKLDGGNWGQFLGDLKDDPTFKPYQGKDISEVFKGYANASKLIGGDKIVIPAGKLDTDANWTQVWDKLGRPKDHTGYDIKLESGVMPEGTEIDPKIKEAFTKAAHVEGLLPKQAQGIFNVFAKYAADVQAQSKVDEDAAFEHATDTLRKELGTEAKFKQFVGMSNQVVSLYAGSEDSAGRIIEKYGNDPDVIRLLGNIGKAMDEDSLISGGKRFADGSDPQAKLLDIQQNKNNPLYEAYWSNTHPRHQYAVDEAYRLTQLVHGKGEVSKI